jgi:uncharacterized phage infection (PIP) family protein YhgE
MIMSQKAKALLVIIVFVGLMVLPVCYALIREKLASHKTEQAPKPVQTPPRS